MALNFQQHHNELLFVPLGGANEIGMNLNLYHYQGKWLMVDCGIGFADDSWLPGVNVVVPDIQFIRQIRHDLVGVILTHAHEDHLGALPYLWEELECTVYATPFTAAFLKSKLAGEGVGRSKAKIKEVSNGGTFQLGPFSIDMIGLTHSIPEMNALAISTEKGVVLHTGDWKFDPAPMLGEASDEAALAKLGKDGVLAMICDSTNVFVEGRSGSESTVRDNLVPIIAACKGKVIVTTFASNMARLETICKAAKLAGRKIVLAGRSLWRVTEAGKEAGYLTEFDFLPDTEVSKIAKHELLIICTGCQGEPMAALPKITRGDHPTIRLTPDDTIIFSSRMIPGNEKKINHTINSLVRKGIEVITDRGNDIHVSGHPARDELAQMYQHIRPQIAIPVHGEPRHLHEHAKFARSMQVPVTFEVFNGAVIRLSKENPAIIGEVETGYVAVDGNSMLDIDSPVIKLRRKMQDAGVIVITLAIDKEYGLLAPPSIIAPGSLDVVDDKELLEAIREEVELTMENLPRAATEEKVRQAIRTTIRRIYKQELDKKPVIMVELLRL